MRALTDDPERIPDVLPGGVIKLASGGKLPALRRLIDNQQEFIAAFEEIIRRPHDQEEVLREMAVRCLAN